MKAARLVDLAANAHERIERGHGVLKNHADLSADQGALLVLSQFGKLDASQFNPAGNLHARWRDAHDRLDEHRFARAGFPNDAQRGARCDRKVDIMQDADGASRRLKLTRKLLAAQNLPVQRRLRHVTALSDGC